MISYNGKASELAFECIERFPDVENCLDFSKIGHTIQRNKVIDATENIDEPSSHIGELKITETLSITLRQGFLFQNRIKFKSVGMINTIFQRRRIQNEYTHSRAKE